MKPFEGKEFLGRRRTLKSTLHPSIFWEMVKFVALGVLYLSANHNFQPNFLKNKYDELIPLHGVPRHGSRHGPGQAQAGH